MKINPFDFSECKTKEDIDAALYTRLFVLFVFSLVFFTTINMF